MTAPQGQSPKKQASASQPAAPHRFVAGAVDLGAVKAQADQRRKHEDQAKAAGMSPDFVPLSAQIGPETFEGDLVIRSTQVPVVLLVGTARSEASEGLKTLLTSLAESAGVPQDQVGWVFRYIDADRDPQMAQALGVQGLPTVIALVNGRPAGSFEGAQPEEQVRAWVDSLLSATQGQMPGLPADSGAEAQAGERAGLSGDAADPRWSQARDFEAAGEFAAAIGLYDELLADTEDRAPVVEARAGAIAARRLAENGVEGDSEAIVSTAAADPTDVQAAITAADVLLTQSKKVEACDTLIATIAATGGDDRAAARERLLEIFTLFDPSDADIIAARTKMASVLF